MHTAVDSYSLSSYIWLVLAIIGACLNILFKKKTRSKKGRIGVFLLYLLAIAVGAGGFWAFIGHVFFANRVAAYIGWPQGSPFQFEVGLANLAFGILGLLCIWIRGNFWTATIIGTSTFLLGDAYGHIRDMVVNGNYAPGNAGAPLYLDIIIPILLISLWIALRSTERK